MKFLLLKNTSAAPIAMPNYMVCNDDMCPNYKGGGGGGFPIFSGCYNPAAGKARY